MTACVVEPERKNQPIDGDTCSAAEFQSTLWKPVSVLDDLQLPKRTRVIYPDQAVTMDYRPGRLNIVIGKLNRIERIYCG